MRISTQLMQNLAIDAMQNQQSRLSKTQQQLASGQRVLTPADDPSASAQALTTRENLSKIDAYQHNITQARSKLEFEDNVVNSFTDAVQRVRELALQGANASQTPETRASIAVELRQVLDQMMDLANTKDANNEYIFGGYRSQTQPVQYDNAGAYSYQGDSGQRFLQISATRQIAVSDPGDSAFFAVREGNGQFAVSDNAANTGTGIIDTGSVTDVAAFKANIDNYEVIFPAATNASVPLSFNDQVGTNDTLQYTLNINGVDVYQVDENGTPAATLDDLAVEINNDAGTTGVRAYVDNNQLYLMNTSPSNNAISVKESMTGNSAGDGDTLTGYFGNTLTEASPSATQSLPMTAADTYLVVDSANAVVGSGSFAAGANISFAGVQTSIKGDPNMGDRFSVKPSSNQNIFNMVQDLADYFEGKAGSPTEFNNAMSRSLSNLDQVLGKTLEYSARVGGRLNTLDAQESNNADYKLQVQTTLSQLEDLDFAEATARLNLQLVGLQAAQQSFVRIQNLSLFNFIN